MPGRGSARRGNSNPNRLFETSTLVILVSCTTFLVAAAYWLRFHTGGLSRDPHDWSEFGGYLGGVLGPALAMVNLLVLAKTAFDFRLQDQKYQRAKLLFELSQQWTALNDIRHEADDVIRDHPHLTCRELHRDPAILEHALWKVLGFFKELHFAVAEGVVDELQTISLFGQVYVWWYVVGAKKDYPPEWDYAQRHQALYELFQQLEPSEFPKWVEYAETDLSEYQAKVPKPSTFLPN